MPGHRKKLGGALGKDVAYRAVLAANTGGHLAQLVRLSRKMDLQDDPLWITFDHPQSRSLLAEEKNVVFVPYMAPRDWRTAVKVVPQLVRLLSRKDYDIAVSTGAAVAVPVFVAALLRGIRPFYVESVSRFDGPSLTGRMVSRFPGVRLFSQHATWAGGRWRLGPSVLDDFELTEVIPPHRGRLRVFVTLGTIKPYRFDRMVDAVLAHFGADHDITWQLGVTSRENLPGTVHDTMTAEDVEQCIQEADVVISHAGVGSALSILRLGKVPILVPRLATHHEHVDDHQLQIVKELNSRDLAVAVTADEPLTAAAVDRARSYRVTQSLTAAGIRGE